MSFYNRLNLIQDYLFKRTKMIGLPVELVIEVTNNCNLNCSMCTRANMTREVGYMSWELYCKIVNEVSDYLELLYLHGLGEPLFHPQIFKIIKYAKDKRLPVGLSTNATLLTPEMSKKLISSGLDYLIIAIDAVTRATYKKVRGENQFEQVEKNVKNYLKIKNTSKRSPFTVIQFVKTKDNQHETDKFVRRWKRLGANTIRIKKVIDLKKEHSDPRKYGKTQPCFYIWRQLNLVTWNGRFVSPCCMDDGGKYPLGDANYETINQLWNSSKMIALRESQLNGNLLELCRECPYPQPGEIARLGSLLTPDLMVKKSLPFFERYSKGVFMT